jgi:hypothetical protein
MFGNDVWVLSVFIVLVLLMITDSMRGSVIITIGIMAIIIYHRGF